MKDKKPINTILEVQNIHAVIMPLPILFTRNQTDGKPVLQIPSFELIIKEN